MIKLIQDTIDNKDIDNLIEWLKTYPKLTKGELTIQFEKQFSNWIGCKHSVFVNSGSSANLLMFYSLVLSNKLKNKKVVVPSLSWATDLSPVIQLGLTPILVDCNLENLSVDTNHLETLFINEQPSALILVSVLGLSPDIDKIVELCNKYNVILLEDNCESQGTKYKGTKLGNFGLMSSFSTYFGHTMSTIEGGLITTNDKDIYDLLIQLRSHGWDRDLDKEKQDELRSKWKIDDFSALYTFYVPGFNLRSTDLQAFIGIDQLSKVDRCIEKRNLNFKKFRSILKDKVWFPTELEDTFTSSFCIPVIMSSIEKKNKLIALLLQNNIECRPLISGSMGIQPFYKAIYGEHKLPNCSIIDDRGIYVPNHPYLTEKEIELICNLIIECETKS
jgi:CDP-6-deoxy-D-xylo-4-hexulose-3-dehydrase